MKAVAVFSGKRLVEIIAQKGIDFVLRL